MARRGGVYRRDTHTTSRRLFLPGARRTHPTNDVSGMFEPGATGYSEHTGVGTTAPWTSTSEVTVLLNSPSPMIDLLPPASVSRPDAATRSAEGLLPDHFVLGDSVYAPQEDSFLLIEVMRVEVAAIAGRRVLDLCCGSGVIGIAAARLGAREVVAFDINPEAVRSTAVNAANAGVTVDARQGSIAEALAAGPFDVVLSNPPYVPAPDGAAGVVAGGDLTTTAWDAGSDGRSVLDPLCRAVPGLLTAQGMCLFVHSETSGVDSTVTMLGDGGIDAETVAHGHIPLGPVLRERAEWLSRRGLLPPAARSEMLAVVRGRR